MRIELDAGGAEREVPLDSVRFLPPAYPLVRPEDKIAPVEVPALSKPTKQVAKEPLRMTSSFVLNIFF